MTDQQKRAWRVGAIYALFGALWIVLSDRLLLLLVPDTTDYSRLQTWKGWLFIAVTALLVTGLVRRALDRQSGLLRRARESEGRLRAIFDGVGDTIFLLDPFTGRILDSSAMVRAHWGYEPGELRGLGLGHLSADLPSWTEEDALRWIRRAAAGETPVFQWLARRKDGALFWAEISLRRGDLGGQSVVLALVHDISERRAAENALRASEERFSKSFHSRAVAMAITDAQGRHIHVNQALCDLLGCSADELLGRRMSELGVLADPRQIQETAESLQRDGHLTAVELALRHRDGSPRTAICTIEPFDLDGESCWFTVLLDISARREAEEALRASETRLRSLTENAPIFISELDREGHFLFLNHVVPGQRMEDVLGSTFDEWAPPEQRKIMWRAFREAVESGEVREFEARAAGQPGELRWYWTRVAPVLVDGEVRRVVLASQDVTRHREADEALRKSEESLRMSLEAAQQGTFEVNMLTGEGFVSPGYATMLGYPEDDRNWTVARRIEHLHPDDHEMALRTLSEYAGTRTEHRMEMRVRTRDGGWKWVLSLGRVVERDDEGRPLRMMGTHTDITALREAEQARRESEQRWHDIVDAVHEAIFIHDPESGRILQVNRGMLRMYRCTEAQALVGGPEEFSEGSPPWSAAEAIAWILQARDAGPQTFPWHAKRADGSLFWAEVNLRWVLIGNQPRVMALVREVGDRKALPEGDL